MKKFKTLLMTATSTVAVFSATAANAAPPAYPAADIHGNGASSIINALDKSFGCFAGVDTPIGFGADGTTKDFPAHHYYPTSPTTSNPTYHCDTQSIQANVTGHYVSTGSGGGKNNWKNYNLAGIVSMPASFTAAYADGHIQFAMSDSPISSGDLTTYNSTAPTSPASNGTGPAIQIPFYVLPIALAYPPVYGKRNIGGVITPLAFNVKSTFVQHAGDGSVTGGLRLSKAAYCGIMNGTITNWNNATLKTLNGGQSLGDANDPTFDTTGVPIVLVGRNENSGTTNLFTRHLDALTQCNGGQFDTGVGGTDQLPAAAKGDARYDKATGALTTGTETPGKFGLVDGSDGVADVVGRGVADSEVPNPGDRAVHGFLGYVGADFVRPATIGTATPTLYSAALQVGTGTSYNMPTAANATAAFGTNFLPPQSNTSGTYNPTSPAPGSVGLRNDPLAWVLPATATDKLANPAKGYPITGTTNLLLYTCYNTAGKRLAIVGHTALQLGKLPGAQSYDGTKFPGALVNSTAKGIEPGAVGLQIGLLARNGLANIPGAWKTAIWETFLAKIHKATGPSPDSLNLWIQDKLPGTAALIDGSTTNGEVTRNTTTCPSASQGA